MVTEIDEGTTDLAKGNGIETLRREILTEEKEDESARIENVDKMIGRVRPTAGVLIVD